MATFRPIPFNPDDRLLKVAYETQLTSYMWGRSRNYTFHDDMKTDLSLASCLIFLVCDTIATLEREVCLFKFLNDSFTLTSPCRWNLFGGALRALFDRRSSMVKFEVVYSEVSILLYEILEHLSGIVSIEHIVLITDRSLLSITRNAIAGKSEFNTLGYHEEVLRSKQSMHPSNPPLQCHVFIWFKFTVVTYIDEELPNRGGTSVLLLAINIILSMRLYALYGRSCKGAGGIYGTYEMAKSAANSAFLAPPDSLILGCLTSSDNQLAIISWCDSVLLFHVLS
ncbi:hypothetical protein CVT26_006500 [Gymnopilus dilepis]|uniref:Uncharacterized protein n=1 Tax=Gymnopilus dilepis TaxID=231916 RepID=A0A409W178_9AGAR|nr:hypothetical protein CVT26_006500 [Gymnopilus dilepis]